MASDRVTHDPLDEVVASESIDSLIKLGPVQPRGITFKVKPIFAGDRIKSLKFQEQW